MPYLPRRTAPTTGLAPEAGASRILPSPTSRPTQPYRGGSPDAAGQTGLSAVTRLSLRKHEVDPLRVHAHLFGKEAEIDEHTGGARYTQAG